MSFQYILNQLDQKTFYKEMNNVTKTDVKHALDKEKCTYRDFISFLSPQAEPYLEEMAQKAHQLTVQNFGKVMLLFAPIYLSDYCVNHCTYCSFSITNHFSRKKLSMEELHREAEQLAAQGIKHIVILTGESKLHTPISYIVECLEVLSSYFSSISIEVHPMEVSEYKLLEESGVDGVIVYQEVYDRQEYRRIHLKGPKRSYSYRLAAPERACQAGMSHVTIGALLGLHDWRSEAFYTGLHAEYLQSNYLQSQISISPPRIRPHLGQYLPKCQVEEKHLVQAILAYRLYLPNIGLTLSTREEALLRDHLIFLGITKMSAGSSTKVGGYSQSGEREAQFEISDERSIREIYHMLERQGFQPIFKDWISMSKNGHAPRLTANR